MNKTFLFNGLLIFLFENENWLKTDAHGLASNEILLVFRMQLLQNVNSLKER